MSCSQTAWALPGNIDIRAFFQIQGVVRTTGSDDLAILAEERLQLISEYYHDLSDWRITRIFGKFDIVADETDTLKDSDEHVDLDVITRELFLEWSWESVDMRIGRQIITWGIGNRLFVNDVFPKSWVSFLSGRPLQYLKTGSDAVKLNYYTDIADFELVIIPIFEKDDFPKGKRLKIDDSVPSLIKKYDKPKSFEDIQIGLRIQKTIGEIDWNLYIYRGFYTLQGKGFRFVSDNNRIPHTLVFTFPPLHTYGFSSQSNIFRGTAGFEAAYYQSLDDQAGDDPNSENSSIRTLLTYEKEIAKDLTVGMQHNLEYMIHHDKHQEYRLEILANRRKYNHFVALDINQKLLNNNFILSLFTIYGVSDAEIFINPEIKYYINDNWWASCGLNIVEGKEHNTTFGQFYANDNVYLIARYTF